MTRTIRLIDDNGNCMGVIRNASANHLTDALAASAKKTAGSRSHTLAAFHNIIGDYMFQGDSEYEAIAGNDLDTKDSLPVSKSLGDLASLFEPKRV